MNQWEAWHKQLQEGDEDIRVEVVIQELISEGLVSEEDFFFIPNGGFHRMVSKDIEAMVRPGGTTLDLERATIELNRKGIYDGLPEGIFHQNRKSKTSKTIEDIKSEMAYQDEVEKNARLFFAPLDHELILARCSIEANERQMTSDLLSSKRLQGLKKFWSIPSYFNAKEEGKLLLLLPLAFRISRDLESAARAFRSVLNTEVSIGWIETTKATDMELVGTELGQGQLGVDLVTRSKDFHRDSTLLIAVGPMDKEHAAAYSPLKNGYKKLSYLADCFIPADMDYQIEVVISQSERSMELTEMGDNTALGVNTYLN
jgi:hypothetical protein